MYQVKRIPTLTKVELRQFTLEEKKRLEEVHFWLILDEINSSGATSPAPMGTTTPKLLATMLGVNPDVIDYAYNMLNLPQGKPSNNEIGILYKTKKVPAAKSRFTPDTYYKCFKRFRAEGQPTLARSLSDIQLTHVSKFIKRYSHAFMGKRQSLAALGK